LGYGKVKEIWGAFRDWLVYKFTSRSHEVVCQSCDTLRIALESERFEKRKLQDHILELSKPVKEEPVDIKDFKPAGIKFEPWSMKRERLEREDREKAKQIKLAEEMSKLAKLSTEELEKAITQDVSES
jgi:hypothetical protein